MAAIICGQFIAAPASAKTRAAASKALRFLPVGSAVGVGGLAAAAVFGTFRRRAFCAGRSPRGAFAAVLGVFFLVAMTRLPSFGVLRRRHRGRRGTPAQ